METRATGLIYPDRVYDIRDDSYLWTMYNVYRDIGRGCNLQVEWNTWSTVPRYDVAIFRWHIALPWEHQSHKPRVVTTSPLRPGPFPSI